VLTLIRVPWSHGVMVMENRFGDIMLNPVAGPAHKPVCRVWRKNL